MTVTEPAGHTDMESSREPDGPEFARLLGDVLPDYAPHWGAISQDEKLRLAQDETDLRAELLRSASEAVYEAEKKFDRANRLLELIES